MIKSFANGIAVACALFSMCAQAALHDRGGGLIFDDVLNVTWLQDANFAQTSGYDVDGHMTWSEALAWADGLTYFDSVRGRTWADWRLPLVLPVGATWNDDFSYSGTTDRGYNNVSGRSELSYMYYVNLGLKGFYDNAGNWPQYGAGVPSPEIAVGTVTFRNVQNYPYWSGTPYFSIAGAAWVFFFDSGLQYNNLGGSMSVWLVRNGDVAAIPEPETYALFLAGLAVLGYVRKRAR